IVFPARAALASCGWSLDRLGLLGWCCVPLLRRSGPGPGGLGLGSHLCPPVCAGSRLVGGRAPASLGDRIVEHRSAGGLLMASGCGGLSSRSSRGGVLGDLDGTSRGLSPLATRACVCRDLRFCICLGIWLMGSLVRAFCFSGFVRGIFWPR